MTKPNLSLAMGLPPERAIEYFRSRGQRVSADWRQTADAVRAGAFSVAGVTRADVLQDIRESMDRAIAEGITYSDWRRALDPKLAAKGWLGSNVTNMETGEITRRRGLKPWHLETIFRTNARAAYMAGRRKEMLENAERRPYWRYSAVLDRRTRPRHRSLNGRIFRYDDAAWQVLFPPNGYNCFPAGTLIRGRAVVGLKTFYTGKMVELHTRLGHRLAVTANHPVLTARGWLPAHRVEKGDQTLGAAGEVDAVVAGVVNREQAPALAEHLFESLAAQGLRVVPMAAHDFHADALLREPEIEVATADRRLMHEIDAELQQRIGQRQLGAAHAGTPMHTDLADGPAQGAPIVGETVLAQQPAHVAQAGARQSRDGAFRNEPGPVQRQHAPLDVGVALAGGLPGGATLPGNGLRVGFKAAPLDGFGFGSAAQLDAAQPEQALQGATATAGLLGNLLQANPGAIALDEIVEVRHFDWSGHVYDFQTDTGLMIAGGMVVHNCRCDVIALSDEDMAAEGGALSQADDHMETVEVDRGPRGGRIAVTGYRDPQTRELFLPDPGFDHAPGNWGRDVALARRTQALKTRELRTQVWAQLNRGAPRAKAWQGFVSRVLDPQLRRPGNDGFVLGFVDEGAADAVRRLGDVEPTRVVVMTEKALAHADSARHVEDGIALTRDQLAMLPGLIAAPDAVFWDTKYGALVYVRWLADDTAVYVSVTAGRNEKRAGRIDHAVNAYTVPRSRLEETRFQRVR